MNMLVWCYTPLPNLLQDATKKILLMRHTSIYSTLFDKVQNQYYLHIEQIVERNDQFEVLNNVVN